LQIGVDPVGGGASGRLVRHFRGLGTEHAFLFQLPSRLLCDVPCLCFFLVTCCFLPVVDQFVPLDRRYAAARLRELGSVASRERCSARVKLCLEPLLFVGQSVGRRCRRGGQRGRRPLGGKPLALFRRRKRPCSERRGFRWSR